LNVILNSAQLISRQSALIHSAGDKHVRDVDCMCQVYREKYRVEKAACDAANKQRLAKMTDAERSQLKEAAREKRQKKKLRQRRKVLTCLGISARCNWRLLIIEISSAIYIL